MAHYLQIYFKGRYRVLGWTMATLLFIYLISLMFLRAEAFAGLWEVLSLHPNRLWGTGYFWQLFTYGLLHDPQSPFHLLFNGLIIFFLAPALIDRWGERRYFSFMMLTVIGGGASVWLCALLGLTNGPVIGFSGASLGTIVAWCLVYPQRQIYMLGVFPMTGKVLLWATVALEALFALSLSPMSSAAHAGGMLMSAFLVQGLYSRNRLRWWWHKVLIFLRIKKKPNLSVVPTYDKGSDKYIH
jgi:membrane associated rhomboid family serine protease